MKKLLCALLLLVLGGTSAFAANCSSNPYTLTNGTTADANQVMANFNNLLTCANSNLAHNGPNSDITSLSGLTTPLSPAQGGTWTYWGGTAAGTANAQTITATPVPAALVAGQTYYFIPNATNTAAGPTLAPNGLSATTIAINGVAAPIASLPTSGPAEVVYDGTYFELLAPNLTPQPAPYRYRNLLVCGDASTCPDQRGNNFTGISNTGTMTLDFWEAIGGASSDIAVSNVGNNQLEGFLSLFSVGRVAGNSDTHAINFGQVLDSDRASAIAGYPVCLSFWAAKGANYSSASSLLTVKAYAGTDPYDGYTSMVAGTWVGQTTILTITATLTNNPQFFYGCGVMPAGNATNNEAETGINFSFTPVGTGGASDVFALWGVQYEAETLAAGQTAYPTPFEHHSVDVELTDATFRAYVIPEPSAGVNVPFIGVASTSTTCVGSIPFPRIMRNVPTLTASAITPGTTWQAIVNGSAQNLSGIITATANSYLYASVELVSTGMTTGQVCGLRGNGGGAMLTWSVDLL